MTLQSHYGWHEDDPDEYADWDPYEAARYRYEDWLEQEYGSGVVRERRVYGPTVAPDWNRMDFWDGFRLGQPVMTLDVDPKIL